MTGTPVPTSKKRMRVHLRKWPVIVSVVFFAAMVVSAATLISKWPFTAAKVSAVLEKHFGKRVEIGKFEQTYFPPGFVAEDLRLVDWNRKDLPALAVARKIVLKADYIGLLDHHVSRVDIAGLDVAVPPGLSKLKKPPSYGKPIMFELITVTEGSLMVLPEEQGKRFLKTKIKSLKFTNVSQSSPVAFHASLLSDFPPGEIHSEGYVGPWNVSQPRRTSISGSFRIDHADLSIWKDLAGSFASRGKFQGTLDKLNAEGALEVAEFRVHKSKHAAKLSAFYRAVINEENGNVNLEHVEAHLGDSTLISRGEVSGVSGQPGKSVRLTLEVPSGTVQDLLNTATEQVSASMTGAITLRARVEIPPGPGFLRRIHLTGDFGISGGRFSGKKGRSVINHLGESSRGESKSEQNQDTRSVLSALRGHVAIRDGIATLTRVTFRFEGSDAQLSGTYNLLNKGVALYGILNTRGKIADTTHGWKSGLLTVITPFYRRKGNTTLYFTISGTSAVPKFSFRLRRKRQI